jgi:serpin B
MGLALLAVVLAITAIGTFLMINIDKLTASADQPQRADESGVTEQGKTTLASANNAFALDLYRELLNENTQGNLFFSPWSIESVIAMAAEGASGDTASEMLAAGRLPSETAERRSAFAAFYNMLNQADAEYQLSSANALWVQDAYPLHAAYLQQVQQYYAGKAQNLNFSSDPEAARETINSWVERRTKDRIKGLLPPGSIDPMTRLVLTNAIYFKGKWEHEFDPGRSFDSKFWLTDEQSVVTKFMRFKDSDIALPYFENDELQVLKLPYKGDEIEMLILLPKAGVSLDGIQNELSVQHLQELTNQLAVQEVTVQLPRFKFDSKYELNDKLKNLGMLKAFSAEADFSGMTSTEQLYISLVVHQAFIEVNEEGTEAAAATGMAIAGTAAPINQPPLFRAERPFIFAIQHKASEAILFLGKVSDPTR